MSSVPIDQAKVQDVVDKMRREQRAADDNYGRYHHDVSHAIALGMIGFWAQLSPDSDAQVRDEICVVLAALDQFHAERQAELTGTVAQ